MTNDEKKEFGKKEDVLDDLVDIGRRVSGLIKEGDLVTAGFVLDNLPQTVKTDALYAGMAGRIAQEYDKVGDYANATQTKEVLGELLGYTKSKCCYLTKKE